MSLINDALKKAQRQRAEGGTPLPEGTTPAPGSAPEPLQRVARREKPAGFRLQLMLIAGGCLAAVVALALGAVFYFRSGGQTPAETKPATIAAVAPAGPAQSSIPAPARSTATPVAATPALAGSTVATPAPASVPPPTQPLVVAATPSPEPAAVTPTSAAPAPKPVQFSLPPTAPVVAAPVATEESAAPVAKEAEHPKPSARMIAVIEHFRVGGIRVSGADSKVLMNDRVYRLNDIVDNELEIRLTRIEAKELTFEDAHGAVHTRNFN